MSYYTETRQKIREAYMKGYSIAVKVGYCYQLDNDEVDYELPGEKPIDTQEIWYIQMPEPPEGMHPSLFNEEFWRYRTQMKKDVGMPDNAICVTHEAEIGRMMMNYHGASFQITNSEPFKEARSKQVA